MRKILFSIFATSAFFYSVNAQTKVSFETSEGYTMGSIDGQKGWQAETASYKVSSNRASDGVNSLYIQNDDSEEWTGAYTNVVGYDKTVLSTDVFFEDFDSDYAVGLYSNLGDTVADYWMTYLSYFIVIYDPAEESYVETDVEWAPNTWYNFKVEIDKTNNTLVYYIDGQEVYATTLAASDFALFDVSTDNYGSGFYVDNLQVKDSSLATASVSTKEVFNVYPNPTVDVVNFDIVGKISSVEVYDAAGKLVKATKDGAKSINVSTLPKGAYVVKVQTENNTYSKKVIKK